MEDLQFCGFRMYDQNRQPWGSVQEYFDKKIKIGALSGGQRHLMFVLTTIRNRVPVFNFY